MLYDNACIDYPGVRLHHHFMNKMGYVYILTNKPHGMLYVGVSSDLVRRIYQHKSKFVDSFTARYQLKRLVYFEELQDIYNAILREKQLKKYSRKRKLMLIETMNVAWRDLYLDICGQ